MIESPLVVSAVFKRYFMGALLKGPRSQAGAPLTGEAETTSRSHEPFLITQDPEGGIIHLSNGETRWGRNLGNGTYEVQSILSPSTIVRPLTKEGRLERARVLPELEQLFRGRLASWSAVRKIFHVPASCEEALERVVHEGGFELLDGEVPGYAAPFARRNTYIPVFRPGLSQFAFPAFSIAEAPQDAHDLQFGHLRPLEGVKDGIGFANAFRGVEPVEGRTFYFRAQR